MRTAAETFCLEYEQLDKKLPMLKRMAIRRSLEKMIDRLREEFIPALEALREQYGIPKGKRAVTWSGGIGEPEKEIHVVPPDQQRDR